MNNTNEMTAKLKAAEPYELKFSRLWERYDEASHSNAEHMRDILELTLDALENAERRIAKYDRDARALTEALESAEKRIAEQREYYESVIADGSKRIAELEFDLGRNQEKLKEMREAEHEVSSRYVNLRRILGTDSLKHGENHFDATEAAAGSLKAGIDSRRLTVKLPPVMRIEEPGLSFNAYGQSGVQNALYEACAAAGIKLQIEAE
ncbi:ead/Ea22-like family protein [Siccibacter colletis]|uniref:ead/Ea22-like family protein n=1 Tax=Siccibacter colletis TaxID=1505757 RepID=UPI00068DA5E8|nr:ead/Ea22-like family protein [Siccibacter colletis]